MHLARWRTVGVVITLVFTLHVSAFVGQAFAGYWADLANDALTGFGIATVVYGKIRAEGTGSISAHVYAAGSGLATFLTLRLIRSVEDGAGG